MDIHEKYIKRCFELAQKGIGNVSPNPLVGCVIVKNGLIIGEGYHAKFGEAHAEVNAINSVRNKKDLENATLYVNLEPCAHHGKTPPCATMIAQTPVKKVVISNIDPFAKVAGKGIKILKDAGIEVEIKILEKEGAFLNRRFFTFHKKERPYIILKWAESTDGFIDFNRAPNSPVGSNRITDDKGKQLVHKWRSEESAFMVGTNTALKDNPALTNRDWAGKNPVRILLDRHLKTNESLKLYDNSTETIIYTYKKSGFKNNVTFVHLKDDDNILNQILFDLHKKSIQSVVIEGGAYLLQSFINDNLWDEARVFKGSQHFLSGIKAPLLHKKPNSKNSIGNSCLRYYYNF